MVLDGIFQTTIHICLGLCVDRETLPAVRGYLERNKPKWIKICISLVF